jgi:single-stranded DNA-binding protein
MSIEAAMFGALGRDAELKTSKNGKPYLRLNVRVGDGDAAQWVSAMVFDPEATAISDKFVKAARIYIEGSLRLDEWTDQAGAKRHGLSVMSWHCRLAAIGRNKPRKRDDSDHVSVAGGSVRRSSTGGGNFYDDPIPFAAEWR